MRSKKKLIISMLVVSFVLLSIIATVAIAFALTQQTIKTSLNIGYTVEDIDGTASASFTIGGVTESLVAMKGTNVIGDKLVFKAGNTENAGNLMFPEDALALTAQDSEVVIQYTYSNTGSKHYIASMDLNANILKNNMKVEYSINGSSYSEQPYAVVVPANTSNRSYWIKISIIDKAKSASFTGDFDWLLEGCDPQSADYLTITSSEFQATGTAGSYSVKLNGEGYLPGGEVIFPSEVNGDPVTTIAANWDLTQEQKSVVKSVYIPDSVEIIDGYAFQDFKNLETVIFEQNETVSGVSAQSETGLKEICVNAFAWTSIIEIEIPETVTFIDPLAFYGCSFLEDVYFLSKTSIPSVNLFISSRPIFYSYLSEGSFSISDGYGEYQPNIVYNYTNNCSHDYHSGYYRIENGLVYTFSKCVNCGNKINKNLVQNAIIANKDNVQDVLDSDINGKTIVFDGYFGIINVNSEIYLRPTFETSTVYEITPTKYELGEVVDKTNLNESTKYNYVRNIENVTFAGVASTIMNSCFNFESDENIIANYDAVKKKDVDAYSYVANMSLKNIAFKNINFSGSYGRIYIHSVNTNTIIDNIIIKNCSFYTTSYVAAQVKYAAIFMDAIYQDTLSNITLEDNYIEGHYQGLYTINVRNLNVLNNTITKTAHNAIAVQNKSNIAGTNFSGNINVVGNNISNASDRAMRFGTGANANIVIENNNFINCADGTSLLKTQTALAGSVCSYTFTNNTYGGSVMGNASGTYDESNYWEIKTN